MVVLAQDATDALTRLAHRRRCGSRRCTSTSIAATACSSWSPRCEMASHVRCRHRQRPWSGGRCPRADGCAAGCLAVARRRGPGAVATLSLPDERAACWSSSASAASPSATRTWPSPASRPASWWATSRPGSARDRSPGRRSWRRSSGRGSADAAHQRRGGQRGPLFADPARRGLRQRPRLRPASTTAARSTPWPSGRTPASTTANRRPVCACTVGEGITGWVAATGQQLIVDDAANDPRAVQVPGSAELAEESMLLAPLRSEGRVIGVVVLSRLGLARFSDDELRLLGVLADQAAVAIENARLLAERDRHVAELAGAARHQPRPAAAPPTSGTWPTCSRPSCAMPPSMDACLISRWDEETGRLVPIGADGRPLDRPRARPRVAPHAAPRAHQRRAGRGSTRASRNSSQRSCRASISLGAPPRMLLPLSTGGRVAGVVEFVSETAGRRFNDGETTAADDGQPGRIGARERSPACGSCVTLPRPTS